MSRGKYITAEKVKEVKAFYQEFPEARTLFAAELFEISQSSVQAINRGEYDKLLSEGGEQLELEDIASDVKPHGAEQSRLNLKLPASYKAYLKEASHQNRMSLTSYLNGLIEADMEKHPHWHEPEPDTAETLMLDLYDTLKENSDMTDEAIGSFYMRLVNLGVVGSNKGGR